MATLALATLAVTEAPVVALIVALATGLPALIFAVYRWHKTGPQERDDLIVAASQKAVAMMSTAIEAATTERAELMSTVARQGERIERCERRIRQLEKAWPKGHALPSIR